MLIRQKTLRGVVEGRVTLQFRRWKRPTVKEGGTLMTSLGRLAIGAVTEVALEDLPPDAAAAAGFADLDALKQAVGPERPGTRLYRIEVGYAGADPRVALREEVPEADEIAGIVAKLDAWDARSTTGAWTQTALRLIAERPATLAAELADAAGLERTRFKQNVRKLKGLGLTESLERGYRLSPRGRAVLEALDG